MHNIAVTTECVADIPAELLKRYDIDIIYYDVKTDSGLFRDGDEIHAENIMEYMMGGEKKAQSVIPSANNYKNFFHKKLEEYDEVIHISVSSKISDAQENAKLGIAKLGMKGHKVHLVDSEHLSTGQGILVMEAARLRDRGMDSEKIAKRVRRMIPKVYTSFLANNADYLYYNGKVSKRVMQICRALKLHPVFHIKDGVLTIQTIYYGSYKKAATKYLNKILKQVKNEKLSIGIVTYAGCGHQMIEWINEKLQKEVTVTELWEQKASATVSCNCGPLTFGVFLWQMEENK